MISYTRKNIQIITITVSIIIFIIINSFFQLFNFASQSKENPNKNIENETTQTSETKKENEEQPQEEQQEAQSQEWLIEIPTIGLTAEISEGTEEETMNKYVGHFQETSTLEGNIGLAAHNRGYPVNYFAKVKELKQGDEIHYKYRGKEKIYKVEIIKVIKDTDWTYLEKTEENKITLITCVEDAPKYRRCVQAIEKKEEINEEN